jgi:hypothetical protein
MTFSYRQPSRITLASALDRLRNRLYTLASYYSRKEPEVLSHAQLATLDHSLTIRGARPEDADRLRELAELDSARPLDGEVLVAEAGYRPLAAIDVHSGRIVADPFRRTAREADLLRARAEQLRARSSRARRRNRRRAIGRLAGAAR